tara:strand:+ start:305 stop:733 length:429 start_codon:yes stop_codon:yes gene_type:complete
MDKKEKLFATKLRSSNLRPTKQRLQISKYLFDRKKTFHFTVEDLDRYFNFKNLGKKISLATLYNTVHAFKEAGHLKQIFISHDRSYFDTNISSHHHFFDEKNKEIIDIKSDLVKVSKLPKAPNGKSIKEIEVIIKVENDINS